ncbi:hypothetical protein M1N61_02700 [Peptococcaceae bacterium]|nr:hypothetical protein [Peptococcaceae bacterium]
MPSRLLQGFVGYTNYAVVLPRLEATEKRADTTNGIVKELEVKEVGSTQTKKLSNWFSPELDTSKEMIESTFFITRKEKLYVFFSTGY